MSQAGRTLKNGGALAVIGSQPHHHKDGWYVYHYFEGVYACDLQRFPTWEQIRAWMQASGFKRIKLQSGESLEFISDIQNFILVGFQ